MTRPLRLTGIVGAILAGLAVAFGAFGAHGLRSIVTSEHLQVFETGVRYQMYHAIGMIIASLVPETLPHAHRASTAAWCFGAGTVLFSGSLYLLVLTNAHWLGIITPVGGLLFLAGWVLFALAFAGRK